MPASGGKTTILTERIKHLINEKHVAPSQIVAITFTNLAADNIYQRLNKPKGLHISTVHSYAAYLLRCQGLDISETLEEEEFDKLFDMVKEHPDCIQPVKYLFLDEAQDSTLQQFEFLLKMVNPQNFMLVGDIRQTIYGFAGSRPDLLLKICEASDVYTYQLTCNYRNAQQILSAAKAIIAQKGYQYRDNSKAMVSYSGTVQYINWASFLSLIDQINYRKNYNSWFFLCRSNKQVNELQTILSIKGIPNDTFKMKNMKVDKLEQIMTKNSIKVLTIHSAKGLEADNVVVYGAVNYPNTDEVFVNYVAATRARRNLFWISKKKGAKKIEEWE